MVKNGRSPEFKTSGGMKRTDLLPSPDTHHYHCYTITETVTGYHAAVPYDLMTEIQLRRHHNRDRLDPGYIYHPPFNTIKARRRMARPKPQYHRWTDEEINLIAYCRARKWSYARIQRKHFPSFTRTSLIGTYSRLTLEERGYRASIVANSIAASRVTSRNKDSTLRREEDDRLPALIDRIKRYNLRPNRCQSFFGQPVTALHRPFSFSSILQVI
jgi:hypothetical protein